MLSINTRVMLAAGLLLTAFMAITGFALDKAFRDNATASQQQRLQAHIYGLLAVTDLLPDGRLRIAEPLPEPRLSTPNANLLAAIITERGVSWSSPSMAGRNLNSPDLLAPGSTRFFVDNLDSVKAFAVLEMGVHWESDRGAARRMTFVVAEDMELVGQDIAAFRRYMVAWLGGAAVVLLLLQAVVLRWSLSPLREVADDVSDIEAGNAEALTRRYPAELRGLTGNLNTLLANERSTSERHRNALSDLAHSLKTPLAVMRSHLERNEVTPEMLNVARDNLHRMNEIVEFQLKRAAAASRQLMAGPVPVSLLIEKIVTSLQKVYVDKGVICDLEVDDEVLFFGDESDIYEILGNVLDNAFRYGVERVRVQVEEIHDKSAKQKRPGIYIRVEDDGPGIPLDKVEDLFERGVRLDEKGPSGHGIGLAVVREIVLNYHGSIDVGMSRMGGACITITLP